MLIDWAGPRVVRDAESLVDRGHVLEASFDPPYLTGSVMWNNRPLNTVLKLLPDGTVESECPCWANTERGVICSHVIALGVVLVRRATDPLREAKYRVELRRAKRLAGVDEAEYIRRVTTDTPGAMTATLRLTLGPDWPEGYRAGKVPLTCEADYGGEAVPLDSVPKELPLAFDPGDEALLFVLEDISEGPALKDVELAPSDFLNVLRLRAGSTLQITDASPVTVNKSPMTTFLQMDLDRENGEIILIAHTELPFVRAGDFPFHMVWGRTGWVYGADNLWPLADVLPEPYHGIYMQPVVVARDDVLRFLRDELPLLSEHVRIESDISADLFTVEPATPSFRLHVRGSPASLSAVLYARYGDRELVACKTCAGEHFGIPDPEDLLRYTVRNSEAEKDALEGLARTGLHGSAGDDLSSIVGNREVLGFLGSHLPALRRLGWQLDLEGRVDPYMHSLEFAMPVVHVRDSDGGGWFDVRFDFEDGRGQSLSEAQIREALRKGESYVRSDGRIILIDSDALDAMSEVFSDCACGEGSAPGTFRLSDIYAPFVKASLDAIDGIDVEDTATWRKQANRYNRAETIEPVELPPDLDQALRPYQKGGVNWLRFLELNGFDGLLADEMGLGKTIQTLAWLQLQRTHPEARGRPSLIVCPTSLVENWIEEGARFVPGLSMCALAGSDRAGKWQNLKDTDVGVTSYALLRRDVEQALEHEFAIVVLDEAQHIKNRTTQNAVAAKKLNARHRLVLTGTPIENGVSDLWSIMDFLMPGYLGGHEAFRTGYELPLSRGGIEGHVAQVKLKRKLHPFLLRRLKTEVARDLPPKIERVSMCSLTKDQELVYKELLESSRRRISDMVASQGFNKCRMEILTTLMRLRQVCCHLGLLKLPDLDPKHPSAKMDLFFEFLDEAIDGGHRVLVFSQFVSMLTILREEMEERGLTYCYLDGATKERMSVVRKFNTERKIPVFLISLKAGGTGLNLTGADMVVHFDPWWNPAVEDQATDRAYRIGQKRTVYSIKLITRGTVEEKVRALQDRKKAIIEATIESDDKLAESLNWSDIQELLSL